MSTTGDVDIASLVASVTGRPGVSKCWAQFLEGDAKKFMAALETAEDKAPGSIFRKGAADVFAELGVETNGGHISRHLKRDCKCRPRI